MNPRLVYCSVDCYNPPARRPGRPGATSTTWPSPGCWARWNRRAPPAPPCDVVATWPARTCWPRSASARPGRRPAGRGRRLLPAVTNGILSMMEVSLNAGEPRSCPSAGSVSAHRRGAVLPLHSPTAVRGGRRGRGRVLRGAVGRLGSTPSAADRFSRRLAGLAQVVGDRFATASRMSGPLRSPGSTRLRHSVLAREVLGAPRRRPPAPRFRTPGSRAATAARSNTRRPKVSPSLGDERLGVAGARRDGGCSASSGDLADAPGTTSRYSLTSIPRASNEGCSRSPRSAKATT